MRIIAGEFGSRKIIAPKSALTRPTLDRTRESLFNILADRVPDADVLDLFAGSGAFGFEALSRGARWAVFCDRDPQAISAIRRNADALCVGSRASILHMDWRGVLGWAAGQGRGFDLLFLDPPYAMDASCVIAEVFRLGLLHGGGLIVLEREKRFEATLPEGAGLVRTKAYGGTSVDFIARAEVG